MTHNNSCTVILSLLLLLLYKPSSAAVEKSEAQLISDKLYNDLFENYNKYYRPLIRQIQPINISFGLALNQLIEVDVKHEKIATLIWQRTVWTDEFLTWNPDDYGGIKVLRFDPVDVWLPDVIVQNSVGDFEPIREVTVLPIVVNYNGGIRWYQPLVKTTTCRMNVRYFPYDQQVCHIVVGSWTHPKNEMEMIPLDVEIDLKNYIEHNQWDCTGSSADRYITDFDNVGSFAYIDHTIKLRRKPQFYEMNLVIPTGLISGLAFVAFLLPSASGEKVGFGITVFLSLCVNLLIISEFVPASSKSFPIIGKYYLVCIMMVAFSLIITTMVLTLHHHATVKPVPERIAKLFFDRVGPWIGFPSRMMKRRAEKQVNQEQIDQEAEEEDQKLTTLIDAIMLESKHHLTAEDSYARNKDGTTLTDVINQLSKLEKLCEGIVYEKQRDKRRNTVIRDWQYLSRIVDRLSALVFIVVTTILSFYFILYAKYGASDDELKGEQFYN